MLVQVGAKVIDLVEYVVSRLYNIHKENANHYYNICLVVSPFVKLTGWREKSIQHCIAILIETPNTNILLNKFKYSWNIMNKSTHLLK